MNSKILLAMSLLALVGIVAGNSTASNSGFDKAALLECDGDQNHIADALEDSISILTDGGRGETPLRIIALLSSPLEKSDIDLLRKYGGTVTHRYHRVIYGLAGRVPADRINSLVAEWGTKLALVDFDSELKLAMDTTVPQTRARPLVWDAPPEGYGLEGDPGTTIAILDTGIDDSHPDLSGKLVFWHDFHDEAEPVPVDRSGHGTFVAGIACGTGEVGGNQPITQLTHTEAGPFDPGMVWPVGNWIPVVGNGVVTMDIIWSPYGEACIGFGPAGGPMEGPFCATGTSNYQSFAITELGFYTCNYVSGSISQSLESSALVTTPYEQVGDGYNLFRGMAPGCQLAGFKIMNYLGNAVGFVSATIAAMDSLVACNSQYGIKVANISAGGVNSYPLRMAANNVPAFGTVMTAAAGNSYPGYIFDPGRAANIITVGSVNDLGALTSYTSQGVTFPIKPDVLAPGGSTPPTAGIMGVDTNDTDGWYDYGFPDRVPDDYCNYSWGTSFAAPHVAGLAALVIQALERTGYVWTYTQEDAQLVKSIILMTATETNLLRENYAGGNPPLNRGERDSYEGYGMINADAAIEAVLHRWPGNTSHSHPITFGENPADRRCWAATLSSGADTVYADLFVPETLDADLYVYRANFSDGDPLLVASSTSENEGDNESLVFVPGPGWKYYLTVKRISGFGEASLGYWYSPVDDQDIQKTRLVGNYPNPFNPRTTIKFNLGQQEHVTVSVYDIAGRQVAVLEDRVFEAGPQEVTWDGSDSRGTAVASGSYFVRMKSGSGEEQKKIMLVR